MVPSKPGIKSRGPINRVPTKISAVERDFSSLVSAVAAIADQQRLPSPHSLGLPHASRSQIDSFKNVFDPHGTDKASNHSYHLVYPRIISALGEFRVLEIGIGSRASTSDNPDGFSGTAGGSLRAWKDLGATEVVGLDLEPELPWLESGITTLKADSLSPQSLEQVARIIRSSDSLPNLIVDDSLHQPLANFLNLYFLFPLLEAGGFYVVEDVHQSLISTFRLYFSTVNCDRFEVFDMTEGGNLDNVMIVASKDSD